MASRNAVKKIRPGKCTPGSLGNGAKEIVTGSGYLMVKAVADSARVPVRAAVNCQDADPEFAWEGETITVEPGGSAIIRGK